MNADRKSSRRGAVRGGSSQAGSGRGEAVVTRVKEGVQFVRDRVDVDVDLDKTARGARAGYKAKQQAGRASAVAGAVTGAVKSGGIRVRVRDEPRPQQRRLSKTNRKS
jgi:hypothetical protein